MDTRDLRDVLHGQSGRTSLTPQAVWEYAQQRRNLRQRIVVVTVVAVFALVAGIAALYLNGLSSRHSPQIVTVPAAVPPTPGVQPSCVLPMLHQGDQLGLIPLADLPQEDLTCA
ncbi:hypothetical protein [Arachnia propionica]|uniref:Uncharacterized protein n=1 Tax=Arachnia propionica TaxID=1750 RepID=A0A3P1WPX0_9ACTN|nr:hypothetical protein [Arachnia propionica]RRD46553.1 hypothetical protein EII35_15525 [Arachnia propionica]